MNQESSDRSEMKGVIEMDAVIHVKPNIDIPAVYFTTGINNPESATMRYRVDGLFTLQAEHHIGQTCFALYQF